MGCCGFCSRAPSGRTPAELQFERGGSGKPRLIAETDGNRLQFNVSHSGDLILIAVTIARAVGIDVEQIRPGTVAEQVARSFSSRERDALAGLRPPLLQDAFFACWTRKEAYIKARGDGLSLPLDSFDVAVLPGDRAQLIATRPDATEAKRWTLRDLDVGPGYKAALAVEGSDWRLKTWDVPPLAFALIHGRKTGSVREPAQFLDRRDIQPPTQVRTAIAPTGRE